MKDNAFTKYFILILLLLCVVVTPFSSCHKENDILPSDTTLQENSPALPQDTTPEEPAPPAKETILQDGVPYTGELNGTHSCQVLTESGLVHRTITINEDKITVESYPDGTEPLGAYRGTLNYDPVRGSLRVHLSFKYYEGKGTTVHGTPNVVRGKLYEYKDRVYFICEASDLGTLSPDNPQLMSFPPQHVTPDTLSVAEWAAAGFKEYEASPRIFHTIRAFLRADVDDFAKRCGVNSKVYDSLRGMKFGTYRLYREEIPAEGDPQNTRGYAVLEVEILESQNDALCAGAHRLVFDEGLAITFTPLEEFKRYPSAPAETVSPAQIYVGQLNSDTDFYRIQGDHRTQFGLCDFIVTRLNAMAGNYEPRTAEEIRAYAETYLGVDGDTLNIEGSLDKQGDGYIRIGRGSTSYVYTVVAEEIRDGITVVTVQFWADYSRIVPSRLVEFHLEWMGSEYRPVKTVILEDSEFGTAKYST